jgi:rRNA-processing protein FCF1
VSRERCGGKLPDMMLKESATAAAAVEALRVAEIEAPNAFNPPSGGTMRDSYMTKIDELEGQLGNVFERSSVLDLLHTTRYWFIANNPATPTHLPMFRTVNNAVNKEIRALVDRLTTAHEQFKYLGKWLELSPGTFTLLDSNILMHCQPINTIDWHTELKTVGVGRDQAPRLIVPLAVVNELDRKKFEGGDIPRGRAQKAIKSLRDMRQGVTADAPAIVKAAGGSVVTLEIPRDDIGRMPMTNADNELIDFGQFLKRAGHRTVVIVTRDLTLQIRAERAGLEVVWLDDKYHKDKRPAAVDSDE